MSTMAVQENASEKMLVNPTPTVSLSLFELLSDKLYSASQAEILMREFIQNSHDAQREIGCDEPIEILINILETTNNDYTATKYTITCRDKGVGMSRETLANHFFCAGSSGKRSGNTNETGGFGIAAINILSKEWFSVRSRDYIYNSRMMKEQLGLRDMPNMARGTEVKVFVTRHMRSWHLEYMLQSAYMSDAPFKITIRNGNNFVVYEKDSGGFSTEKIIQQRIFDNISYKMTGFNNKIIKPTICSFGANEIMPEEIKLRGMMALRLNGLTQFRNVIGGIEQCYYVDISTSISPSSKEYPFSVSRETLQNQDMETELATFSSNARQNPVTASNSFNEEEVAVKEVLIDGEIIKGMRDNCLVADEIVGENSLHRTKAGAFLSKANHTKSINNIGNRTKIRLDKHYVSKHGENPIKWHLQLLKIWESVLEIIVEDDENFFIGLTYNEQASRGTSYKYNAALYSINPEVIYNCESKAGVIVRLRDIAIHEYAHRFCSSHDENFALKMHKISGETIELFLEQMGKIKRKVTSAVLENTDCPKYA